MEQKNSRLQLVTLGIQHLFAMFGATVLVPKLTGLHPAVALITAGIGTLIFHLITKRKVPVFLGSSFAFIPALAMIINENTANIPLAQGGIIVAGLVYAILSLIIYAIGVDRIKSLFPPIVTGPVIMVIGLSLSPSAVAMASEHWGVALVTLGVVVAVTIFARGFFKLVPILFGIIVGYASAYFLDLFKDIFNRGGERLLDFTVVQEAPLLSPFWDFTSGAFFTLPQFDWRAIILIAPIALVTLMEHIGDMTASGMVVGRDFLKDPGLHRTLLGDGVASLFAGLIGGPANTTYSENTGVLAVTKVYNPLVLELAAIFAIILGMFGKFAAVLQTIPDAVMGGVSIVLFGMIAGSGLRTVAEAKLDFSKSRNIIIVGIILVVGIGLSEGVEVFGVTLSGLFLAVVLGAVLNKILPKDTD